MEVNLVGLQIFLHRLEDDGFEIPINLTQRVESFYELEPDEQYDSLEIEDLFNQLLNSIKVKANKNYRGFFIDRFSKNIN